MRNLLRDHPRLCGEKQPCEGEHVPRAGITPAYAGKRPLNASPAIVLQGSPPPMRGKVSMFEFPFSISRITPAYAGKSTGNRFTIHIEWDHPRLCGEKAKSLPLRTA